jgi:hypothetical protein
MIMPRDFLSTNFNAAGGGIGDIYGLPVTKENLDKIPKPNLYFLWIGLDDNRKFYVRKYKEDHPADIDAAEQTFVAMGAKGEASKWNGDSLNSLEFRGAGRFTVVLGIPDWTFYNYPKAGHEPIVFQDSKEYFSKDPNNPTRISLKGTFNHSFFNGKVGRENVTGQQYPIFRCDNYCNDTDGVPLEDEVRLDLLFNINVEVPIGSERGLVIIDPAGGNMGPPGAP